ncbi:transporter [Verminephrobacter aporrectodeae subsp. tuberculatae]|uniref:L-lactate permease n=3 Tax=Verminephrobacter TaxID=364316 RepID=A0ABT3KQV0_9BURK|nr:transporter [Verminephrobacter aporrectodeae subsp. tuberculatae]
MYLGMLQISPILVVMSMILLLRRPPVQASVMGAALAIALWLGGAATPFSESIASAVSQDTLILFASTTFVMAPGLLFVIFLERGQVNLSLSSWVKNLGLSPRLQVVFIVFRLAPLLESMTGFGVSLIATVPLLVALFDKERGIRVALCGMAIMPWGTLGLATVIGAALAGISAFDLGSTSAFTSAPVFVGLACIALFVAGLGSVASASLLVLAGTLFITVLHLVSLATGPEIAGVSAAAVITIAVLAFARIRAGMRTPWPVAAWPYGLLLGIIVVLKLFNTATGFADHFILQGDQIRWKPLASPGVALLLMDLLLLRKSSADGVVQSLLVRAKRPLLTIFFFLLMSQVLVKAGFLKLFTATLGQIDQVPLVGLVATLGGLAGYLTGSNVGGNAIVMPQIAHLGLSPEYLRLFAAIQNSAAGHAALGSLPMVSLILGLAKQSLPQEQQFTRFAFFLAVFNVAMVALAGAALLLLARG